MNKHDEDDGAMKKALMKGEMGIRSFGREYQCYKGEGMVLVARGK